MNRLRIHRRIAFLALMVLLLGLSGCGGGARASSWPGLTLVEDKLYVADLQQVRVMNAADGESVWAFPEEAENNARGVFYATPAVGGGHVFVASEITSGGFISQRENIVWALEAETGNYRWEFKDAAGQYIEGGALSEDNTTFIIGNGDGNVYALDAESGDLKWTFKTEERVWATPLVVGDTVYIGSMDHRLYALSMDDGEMIWSFEANGAFAGTPALYDGVLYLGAFDDKLYAIDAESGEELWRFEGENWFWGGPAVEEDTVYATDVDGNVYALKADDGVQLWHQELGAAVRSGPTLGEDGTQLFIGTRDGTLYALDVEDGFVMWTDPSTPGTGEGRVLSRPIVSESLVYKNIIYGTHRIRALHVENGREAWVYPQVEEEQEN